MVVELRNSVRISGPQLSAASEFLSSSALGHDVVEIVTGSQFEVPGLIVGQYMWDLSWTKCHWDRFLSEYFSFLLIIAFH
jgi:DNA-binding transcriptional regulator PaaX